MKVKEYIRLGKISIKSRKKSTRNTVRGIAFGLIMLVPIVFFTLAFYLDLTDKINQTHNISSFYVHALGENEKQEGAYDSGSFVFGNTDVQLLQKRMGEEIEDMIYTNRYSIGDRYSDSESSKIKIGSLSKSVSNFKQFNYDTGKKVNANADIKVIDRERSNGKLFPDGFESDLKNTGKKVFAAGGGFSENGKGEIIVSEMIVKAYNLSPESAIGSSVTVTANGRFDSAYYFTDGPYSGYYLDNDTNPDNTYVPNITEDDENDKFTVDVIRNFKIVGVISEDYFLLNKTLSNDANFWISEDSQFVTEDGERHIKYLPSLASYETENDNGDTAKYQIVTYSIAGKAGIELLAEQAAAEHMFFPAIPALIFTMGTTNYSSFMPEEPYTSVIVQCKDYDNASKIETILNNAYTRISGEEASAFGGYVRYYCATEAYSNFSMLHQIGGYLMVVMYTFGGIIFFATLLNLYNSVNYSVQARRNYIGMMRAIGAKQKVIPRLYFVEILLIFWRSFLWVLIFGGGISYGIKALIDMLFKQEEAAILGAAISLNFGWFFVALVSVIVLVFFIAFLFSRVACRAVTKKGILEVLSDDK